MRAVAGIAFCALLGACGNSQDEFSGFVGVDLSTLDASSTERLNALLTRRIPDWKTGTERSGYTPRFFWNLAGGKAPPRRLLIEIDTTRPHPGSTLFRLHTFDGAGGWIRSTDFTCGHRAYLGSLTLKRIPVSDYPVVELTTESGGGPGPAPDRQTYGMVDDEWKLIRFETAEGLQGPNYHVRHWRCGPELRPARIESVEKSLDSPRTGEVLAMLTWLSGVHGASRPGETGSQYEDPRDAELHARALAAPSVRHRIEAMSKSKEPWVREAAEFALKR